MKLQKENVSIIICDVCIEKNLSNSLYKFECLSCKKDCCENHSGKSYFNDGWVTYDLRGNTFPFCGDCTNKIGILNKDDWKKAGLDIKGYSGKDEFNNLSRTLLDEAKESIYEKLHILVKDAISVADERYAEQIEIDKRKGEIKKEIEELEKKKNELNKSL